MSQLHFANTGPLTGRPAVLSCTRFYSDLPACRPTLRDYPVLPSWCHGNLLAHSVAASDSVRGVTQQWVTSAV